jgi:hypothetical protein
MSAASQAIRRAVSAEIAVPSSSVAAPAAPPGELAIRARRVSRGTVTTSVGRTPPVRGSWPPVAIQVKTWARGVGAALRRGARVGRAVGGRGRCGEGVDDGAGLGERFGVEVGDQPAAGAAEVAPEPQPAPLVGAGLGGGPVVVGAGRVERRR